MYRLILGAGPACGTWHAQWTAYACAIVNSKLLCASSLRDSLSDLLIRCGNTLASKVHIIVLTLGSRSESNHGSNGIVSRDVLRVARCMVHATCHWLSQASDVLLRMIALYLLLVLTGVAVVVNAASLFISGTGLGARRSEPSRGAAAFPRLGVMVPTNRFVCCGISIAWDICRLVHIQCDWMQPRFGIASLRLLSTQERLIDSLCLAPSGGYCCP